MNARYRLAYSCVARMGTWALLLATFIVTGPAPAGVAPVARAAEDRRSEPPAARPLKRLSGSDSSISKEHLRKVREFSNANPNGSGDRRSDSGRDTPSP